jgi:hypothetical protein
MNIDKVIERIREVAKTQHLENGNYDNKFTKKGIIAFARELLEILERDDNKTKLEGE